MSGSCGNMESGLWPSDAESSIFVVVLGLLVVVLMKTLRVTTETTSQFPKSD